MQGGTAASSTLDLGAATRFGVARRGPLQLLGVVGVAGKDKIAS